MAKRATILQDLHARGFDRSSPLVRDESGRFTRACHVECSQCEALVISGVACHETGCPNQTRECDECGTPIARRYRLCEDCSNPQPIEDNDDNVAEWS